MRFNILSWVITSWTDGINMHHYNNNFYFRYCHHEKEEAALSEDNTSLALSSFHDEEFQEDLTKLSESPKLEFKAGNAECSNYIFLCIWFRQYK